MDPGSAAHREGRCAASGARFHHPEEPRTLRGVSKDEATELEMIQPCTAGMP
jgi:hypothetical protein